MPWLEGDPRHSVGFYYVLSKAKWPPHLYVHQLATGLWVPTTTGHASLALHCKLAIDCMTKEGVCLLFSDDDYPGFEWLHLSKVIDKKGNKATIHPTHLKGGSTWLKEVPNIALMSPLAGVMTGHAPIKSYGLQFQKTNTELCPLCEVPDTADYTLFWCARYSNSKLRQQWCNLSIDVLVQHLSDLAYKHSFMFEHYKGPLSHTLSCIFRWAKHS